MGVRDGDKPGSNPVDVAMRRRFHHPSDALAVGPQGGGWPADFVGVAPRFLSQFGPRSLRDLLSSHLTRSNVAKAGPPVALDEVYAPDGATGLIECKLLALLPQGSPLTAFQAGVADVAWRL
jgi:hypothetical protein